MTKKDLSGGTDDPSNYTTADDIKSYTAKGYELVSDDYPSGGQSLRMSHNTMSVSYTHLPNTCKLSAEGWYLYQLDEQRTGE